MDIATASIEELYKEIEARKQLEQAEIRKQLEEARKVVRELERKLDIPSPTTIPSRKPRIKLSPAEKAEKVFEALDGRGFTTPKDLMVATGLDGNNLRKTLQSLITEGLVVKEGLARGTTYKLASKE